MSQSANVRYAVRDGIAVITVDNPPVNALGPGVREGIIAAVQRGNADPQVTAFVLTGAGRNFIAGADIRQFGKARPVSTAESTAAFDASAKPIVAAINGYALGGGLEHALGCHYRIATPGARVGLPEVTLGIVPGGGGTQRLPRLVGPSVAMEMIASGRHVPATEALRLGIIAEIVGDPDFLAAAIAFAKRVSNVRPLPRVRDMEDRIAEARSNPALLDELRRVNAPKSQHVRAPHRALDCVVAAVTSTFDAGIAFEQAVLAELENADEAKALRYAFFSEREAGKLPGMPADLKPQPVRTAAVVGAGTMGSGIAICFADAGIPVKVLEATPEALERGMQRVRETYLARVRRGSLSPTEMDRRMSFVEAVVRYEDIAECDAVIEAVFERMDLKKDVFARLDAVMKPAALLLTNSSAIDIDVMAGVTRRPHEVAGAHFFAPANVMRLCEVVRGTRTTLETIARTCRLGRDLGKISVVAGSCDGFVANRSRGPFTTEMMLMLEEGALPEQIDRVMVGFGYPMGPFAVGDLSGLDISYDVRQRRAAADPHFRKLHVPDRMVELGRKGQKTGAGWYRYEPGDRTPRPDPAVAGIIGSVARELGTPQRSFTDEEILHRLLFASVNEACRILGEGHAWRASDIDVMWLHGFGFPRFRGGLMYWADTIGAHEIARQAREWREAYGERWALAPLLERIAREGGTLRDATGAD